MKRITIILALCLSSTAWATQQHGNQDPQQQAEAQAEADARASAAALAESASTSSATGGSSSADSTSAGGNAEASNNGNAEVSISSVVQSSYKAVRQAPSVALGSVYPTATCQGGMGIGGSGPGGSGLLNFSFTKKECETVVLAQNFAAIGMPETSCDILKTTKAYQRALKANPKLLADCDARGDFKVVPVDPVDMKPYVKRDELAEHERRIIEKVTSK